MPAANPQPAPYRVCLMGVSVSTGNRGVSALASATVKLIRQARPEAEIAFLIGHSRPEERRLLTPEGEIPIRVVNARLSPRACHREHLFWILLAAGLHRGIPLPVLRRRLVASTPWLRALSEADLVADIRGGDSFSDIYGLGRYLTGSVPPLTAVLLDKPLVHLPQTYGPYRARAARSVARFLLRRSACVLSRDVEGVAVVTGLLGPAASRVPVQFCPDVAFALSPAAMREPPIEPPLPPSSASEPLVGLNVNGLIFHGGYTRRNMFGLALDYAELNVALAARLLADTPARLLLTPHTFAPPGNVNSDPDACRSLLERLPAGLRGRVHLVTRDVSEHEIKGIIGRCDFFVGARMHACIAALSQGIPTAGIAYSRKFRGVFDVVGAADAVVDARTGEIPAAVERILALYRAREGRRPALLRAMERILAQLGKTFGEITAGRAEG